MKNSNQEKGRVAFYIERKGALAQAAVILMLLSAVFRAVGCWGLWTDRYFAATQILLPIGCNLLFVLCVLAFGKRGFWLSSLPVLLGVVFFVVKSFGFESWLHTVLCILLYLIMAVLYMGTVFGVIRTKWLLPPLFGLPLIYHLLVEDLPAMQDAANPVTLSAGMQEISVLCIMAALLCVGLALKKREQQPPEELPKIKDPVVIAPEPQPAPAQPAPTQPTPPSEPQPEAAPAGEPAQDGAASTGDSAL